MCIGVLISHRRHVDEIIRIITRTQPSWINPGSNHLAYGLEKKGAPIDCIFPEPFVPVMIPQGFWIAARPPYPHASALFVDFMLSKGGQEILAGQGRWVSRKDVKYLVDPGQKKLQVVSYEK